MLCWIRITFRSVKRHFHHPPHPRIHLPTPPHLPLPPLPPLPLLPALPLLSALPCCNPLIHQVVIPTVLVPELSYWLLPGRRSGRAFVPMLLVFFNLVAGGALALGSRFVGKSLVVALFIIVFFQSHVTALHGQYDHFKVMDDTIDYRLYWKIQYVSDIRSSHHGLSPEVIWLTLQCKRMWLDGSESVPTEQWFLAQ